MWNCGCAAGWNIGRTGTVWNHTTVGAGPVGIRIADRLWQKFGDGFYIWRMEAEDYEKSCSNEVIGTVGIRKLENIHHPQLKLTAEAVKKKEKAGYQENLSLIHI